MKKRPFLYRALALTAAAGMLLTGCTAAAPQSSIKENAPTAESAVTATEETSAEEEAWPDATGAAVFSYAQQEDAALRAQQYWYSEMITESEAHRYALMDSVAASVVPYESCISNERLVTLVSFGEEGKRPVDRIYAGTDLLVEVHFYVEYQPEICYLGPQYGDGLNSVYILVPVDTAQPCEVISGWYSDQYGANIPRPGQTLMAEGLTIYQSRMVLHQCQAMAAAGLREFTSPTDWTEEELYRYLYYRGQDFGLAPEIWQNQMTARSYANLILTIDFTPENDWSSNGRFLAGEWPGFSAENIEVYTANLDSGAVPGYRKQGAGWQFRWDGDILNVKMNGDGDYDVQRYRFRTCDGFAAWNGRTYCIAGEPLA